MSQEPNGNYLSPLHSLMQVGLGSPCFSYPGTDDLNIGHWGVYLQNGMNEPSPNIPNLLNTTNKVRNVLNSSLIEYHLSSKGS
jgi:hypothetical protein